MSHQVVGEMCTLLNGIQYIEGRGYINFTNENDTLSERRCPSFYHCFGKLSMNVSSGFCQTCNPSQTCLNGTISDSLSPYMENRCPDGHLCHPFPVECLKGEICQNNQVITCAEIQKKAIDQGLGNIHAGSFCNAGSSSMGSCPVGYYCPDARTKIICPAGYFCPHKTGPAPFIVCQSCKEGSTKMVRNNNTIILIWFFVVTTVVFGGFLNKKRRNQSTTHTFKMKQCRAISKKHAVDQQLVCNDESKSHTHSTDDMYSLQSKESFCAGIDFTSGHAMGTTASMAEVEISETMSCTNNNVVNVPNVVDQLQSGVVNKLPSTLAVGTYLRARSTSSKDIEDIRLEKDDTRKQNGMVFGSLQIHQSHHHSTTAQENYISDQSRAVYQSKCTRQYYDVTFHDLCLYVISQGKNIKILNNASGCIESKKMTALIGESGSGKTSLLNSLCGRAYYGKLQGSIMIGGKEGRITDFGTVGFVSQDDIVHRELTVFENLVFAGRILGGKLGNDEILHLADKVVLNLGLDHVKNSIVGSTKCRGISGGEKKRLNIAIELMARPAYLFCDEPTSGLDASCAVSVINCLKWLVLDQDITVCCSIHQPRKLVFDAFDRVIVLAKGGNTVYEGPARCALQYFEGLGYDLPLGENVADWLVDISTGMVLPKSFFIPNNRTAPESPQSSIQIMIKDKTDVNSYPNNNLSIYLYKEENLWKTQRSLIKDYLCQKWKDCNLKQGLNITTQSSLTDQRSKNLSDSPFFVQLWIQLQRNAIIMWRAKEEKLLDTLLIASGPIILSSLNGIQSLIDRPRYNIPFWYLVNDKTPPLKHVWAFTINPITGDLFEYAVQLSCIVGVLLSLAATKTMSSKRLEFFRESSSGYNVNAYFIAVNILSIFEHGLQSMLAGIVTHILRCPISSLAGHLLNFFLLSWQCAAWGHLFSLIVPEQNLTLACGLFMLIFNLLCCGVMSPVLYRDIYDKNWLAVICGFFSPARWFVETLVVSEARCLPEQYGFTRSIQISQDNPTDYYYSAFNFIHVAQMDIENATKRSCDGWSFGHLSAFLVGAAVRWTSGLLIHVSDRRKQCKKNIREELFKNGKTLFEVTLSIFVLIGLYAACVWSILWR